MMTDMHDIASFDVEASEDDDIRVERQDLRLLKAIVTDKTVAREFVSTFDYTLFMYDAKPFAKLAMDHIKAYKSPPTRRTMLESASGPNELKEKLNLIWDQLDEAEFNRDEFEYDLEKVKSRYTKTEILSLKDSLDNFDFDNANHERIIRQIRNKVDLADTVRRGQRQVYVQKTMKDYMPEFFEEYKRKAEDPDIDAGINTGYSYLDYATGGLRNAQMLIIAAESSAGKSMLLNNMAIQIWMQKNTVYTNKEHFGKGYNILYFSLEMPFKACVRRSIARLSELPIYGIRDCNIKSEYIKNLNRAVNFINQYPYHFEVVDIPRGVTVEQIEARYDEAVSNGRKPDVVVVDYLGLMECNDIDGDDWLRLGYISAKLHEFARAYDTIVLTAVQLNRPGKTIKDSADLIGMHRIGRSSLIIHHADIGIQIESRKGEKNFPDMVYHIIKNRDGELGKHVLSKKFYMATIKDMDEPYKPPEGDGIGSFITANAEEDISTALQKYDWYGKKEDDDGSEK